MQYTIEEQVTLAQGMAEAWVFNTCARAEDFTNFDAKMKAARDRALWAVLLENKGRTAHRLLRQPWGMFRNSHGFLSANIITE